MALDDYFETEVGLAVAATAALLSPRARGYLRRGAVYGLAGMLAAGDAVAAAARRVGGDSQAAQAQGPDGGQQAPAAPA